MTGEERGHGRPVNVETRNLLLRLAENTQEIEAAQALRYRVFYEGMAATPTPEIHRLQRDFDSFDEYCDHLLLIDREVEAVIGTYRFMRREAADRCGQFYTSDEYDVSQLLTYPGEVLELGRSCIDADYRNGATMQLLWRGIAEYVFHFNVDLMFGCASLPGTDPSALSLPLSFLHHYNLAPPGLRPRALTDRFVDMAVLPIGDIDVKLARQALPPLIKGYLRLGGFVGEGAVVDHEFGTTDVCVVVKTDWVTEKYLRHYSRSGHSNPQSEAPRAAARQENG